MFEKLILKLAENIVRRNGGKADINNAKLVIMSERFYNWSYREGYFIWVNYLANNEYKDRVKQLLLNGKVNIDQSTY